MIDHKRAVDMVKLHVSIYTPIYLMLMIGVAGLLARYANN